ncbi:MAG: DUF4344 domain-containing metallopeptidase [Octadecabacter sp.]
MRKRLESETLRLFLKAVFTRFYIAVLAVAPSIATADVSVSSDFHRWAMQNQSVSVSAGNWVSYNLNVPIRGAITVDAEIQNNTFDDGSAYICDETSYRRFQQGQPNNCLGMNRTPQRINFTVPVSAPGTYYLILDNSFSMLNSKQYNVSVIVPDRMDPQFRRGLTDLLRLADQYVETTFQAPDFKLSIESCGQANAYSVGSTGDIVLCSELLFAAGENQSVGMVIGTLFHEIGHSLLNLWGLPNFANEETVDEFATYILLQGDDPSFLRDYIEYHERQNSWAQASQIIEQGGTHPLSAQRARNVRRNMQNAAAFSERWNRLIYPHMTDSSLLSVVRSPTRYNSVSIAQQVLRTRGVTW